MANQAVIRFVRNLVAAFSRWKTADDTIRLYTEKLSRWHLSDDEWSAALSRIVSDVRDDSLPTLATIYQYLQIQNQPDGRDSDLGWMTWEKNGRVYSMRIRYVDGQWVWASMVHISGKGEKTEKQPHVGERAIIPAGCYNSHLIPDRATALNEPESSAA